MPKQIIADVFETLGGAAKQTGQQAVSNVKKAGEDVWESLGIKSANKEESDEQKKSPELAEKNLAKMKIADKKRAAANYQKLLGEIKQIQQRKKQEIPKQISGQPGFSEEKAVKQLETKKEEKKKLPPLPIQRATKKAEVFRGVAG